MTVLFIILAILSAIFSIVFLFFFIPLMNWFMTQVVFKSKRRTRKMLRKAHDLCRKVRPDASEKELLPFTLQTAFCVLGREDYPQKPYRTKPKSILTIDDVDEIVKEATDIDNLVDIVIERDLSPDMAPWF